MGWVPFDKMHDRRAHRVRARIGERITSALADLLIRKHLYQSTGVGYQDLLNEIPGVREALRDVTRDQLAEEASSHWEALDKANRTPSIHETPPNISFSTPDVKLYCVTCDRVEAFNSVSSLDISERSFHEGFRNSKDEAVQIFGFSFQCQSCKGPPEVFLVRRAGNRLTLSGRAPIEHVEVPPELPKLIRKWYKSAIVAHQSGQTLAGLFLLRTLIEQWVRQTTGDSDSKADACLEQYKNTLPDDFKQRFPSLGDIYRHLSEDIHSARGSVELFEQSRERIVKHFDARRIFGLGVDEN